eukprot:TRINITY_DN9638_c0_g1_i1.p1 TRINITY_DN9638_c0_g1~~TRINITY_DN9638_c0_g1_i1.p1  ORF type:complete len:511 (-),score=75.77 TRINITY_DN9638_c0_g1_i1:47-1579(-)
MILRSVKIFRGGSKYNGRRLLCTKKDVSGLGIDTKKSVNFSDWYQEVVTRSELIDYHDISGCYILRPWAFNIWDNIKKWLDSQLQSTGVSNAYFPLFVSESMLCREKDHIEGFAPEVAWVTRAGDKDLMNPIAVRPTSETIMYPAFSRWIKSHRDLPMLINQWNNVVRWEFDRPTPFIRSREFLWQEGHTAWSNREDAEKEVYLRLDQYRQVYEHLLSVPVIPGYKSKNEKFAGADFTTTIETVIPVPGKAIQAATSHHLGQNFAKMFDITFDSGSGNEREHVWQNSWGLTTRSIGVMIMVHGDDKGLILPPRISPVQIVIVPIIKTTSVADNIINYCKSIKAKLIEKGIRVEFDDRLHVRPGAKYNHWELKGVPVRIDVGDKEVLNSNVMITCRHSGTKSHLAADQSLPENIHNLFDKIHDELLARARENLNKSIHEVKDIQEFQKVIESGKGVALVPFCETVECETATKQKYSAKSLCLPFDQKPKHDGNCFACSRDAQRWALFGRSF